jgi:hypothetical protein
MQTLLYYLTTLAAIAVLVVLIWGLATLLRGGHSNLSQKLMRWRIALQFIAIVIIMGFVFLRQGKG